MSNPNANSRTTRAGIETKWNPAHPIRDRETYDQDVMYGGDEEPEVKYGGDGPHIEEVHGDDHGHQQVQEAEIDWMEPEA